MKTLFFIIFILTVGLFILNPSNDKTHFNKNDSKQFPDHSVNKLGVEIEYPAPMKQLQQVLTHSYVKEPSDETLNIKVGLEELNYQSNGQSDDSEIKKLQLKINKLREITDKD